MTKSYFSKTAARLLALFLALVTLLSFAACGGEDIPEDTREDNPGDEVDTLGDGIVSNIPSSLKFNNQEVRMYIATGDANKNEAGYYQEPIGIINQEIVERNYNAEDRLGVVLTFFDQGVVAGPDQVAPIRNSILAGGTDGMDLVTGMAYYVSTLASEGLFYNFNTEADNNYVDVTAPWYNQTFVEECSYKDMLFWSVGDFNVTAYDRTPVTFYNEDALIDWAIEEDLYQTVLDGKWTIERLQTLVKDVHEELDNAEGQTKGDFYGLVINGGGMCVDSLVVAAGINLTTKTEDGAHELAWTKGLAHDAFAGLYNLMNNSTGVYLGTTSKEGNTYDGAVSEHFSEDVFYEKRCIFSFGLLKAAQLFATDTTIHYGILPLPKYSEQQEYQTTPHDAYTIVGVPSNIGDRLAIATATLECLNEESYRTVRPVYFETAYKLRYASGENTARLFDLVIDSISFCFGGLYSNALKDPAHQLRNRLTGQGGVVASDNLSIITANFSIAIEYGLNTLFEQFESMSMVE